MVSQCINPSCKSEFGLLNSGDLYALERRNHDTEFFWMCSDCGKRFILGMEPDGSLGIHARASNTRGLPPSPEYDLRLIARPLVSRMRFDETPERARPQTPAYMRAGVTVMDEAA